MLKLATTCTISLLLMACSQTDMPPEQQALIDRYDQARQGLNDSRDSSNEARITQAEKAARTLIETPSRKASTWHAVVESVRQDRDLTVLTVTQPPQTYHLLLADPDMQRLANTLSKGDRVTFSGDIKREHSATLTGALNNPEFKFLPTSIGAIKGPAVVADGIPDGTPMTTEHRQVTQDAAKAVQAEKRVTRTGWMNLNPPILWATIENDGTRQDGFAGYLCLVLAGHDIHGGSVRILNDIAASQGRYHETGYASCPEKTDGPVEYIDLTKQ